MIIEIFKGEPDRQSVLFMVLSMMKCELKKIYNKQSGGKNQ